jgi:hypothetical protein
MSKDTEHRSVDRKLIEIKKVIGETAKEIIGERRRVRNEELFGDDFRIAIETMNADKLIMMQRQTRRNYERYKESRSRANRVLLAEKRGYLKGWMREIEELNIQNESKTFYQTLKWMTKE